MTDLHARLALDPKNLEVVNRFFTTPDNPLTEKLFEVVERFGGPEEINRKAEEARMPESLKSRMKEIDSEYLTDIEWLEEMREKGAFVRFTDWCQEKGIDAKRLHRANAVTLEISALQFFPWLIEQARRSIENRELMPGRFIRVRNMAEQTRDHGDILAVQLAMHTLGATWVETLDTKGTDGSNIHLGGPETITGYFGGIGQPNDHPVKWLEEYLRYYTEYGVREVLNINPGTVLLAYMLHRIGIDNAFKISVFMGNDNPYSILWTLMAARLFCRDDDTTSLVGFNLSNSVDNDTIREAHRIRAALGLTGKVRFEHHITETWKHIVVQPYLRRAELVEIAKEVPNISAKHEGGEPEIEKESDHPSDILDYFLTKEEILAQGLWEPMLQNYINKHISVNLTADALVRAGIGVVCAEHLHEHEPT